MRLTLFLVLVGAVAVRPTYINSLPNAAGQWLVVATSGADWGCVVL